MRSASNHDLTQQERRVFGGVHAVMWHQVQRACAQTRRQAADEVAIAEHESGQVREHAPVHAIECSCRPPQARWNPVRHGGMDAESALHSQWVPRWGIINEYVTGGHMS